MLKVTSIAVSLLILVQSFNVHIDDIVELDELIEHAQFHAEEHGDNFLVFISKHYGELKAEHSKKHQEEKEEHEQLPFQHQYQTASLYAFVLNQAPANLVEIEFALDQDTNFFYQASYHSLAQEGLFQPPRQA
ncbi:hypothetical protein FEE95_04420 [Maribacter algarum]|uniref:Uncharacterized protein n=1 Tax=Maribacter algarum (ex Zhang et al. 2020) TaxID=2578118 RepID=A0A5S3PUQ7_9FLAO|nr:hypothetical protein [Maribacter algarum]TMM58680.1 hypothetical protein FEE95_04420 [Maribacter algarum]